MSKYFTFEFNLFFTRRLRQEAAEMLQNTQRGKVNQATARSISEGKKQMGTLACMLAERSWEQVSLSSFRIERNANNCCYEEELEEPWNNLSLIAVLSSKWSNLSYCAKIGDDNTSSMQRRIYLRHVNKMPAMYLLVQWKWCICNASHCDFCLFW